MNADSDIVVDSSKCSRCGVCANTCCRNALAFEGRVVGSSEILPEILGDEVFFAVSGGGVTFSGGDPLLQAEFVRDLARELKKRHIQIAVETALYAPWQTVNGLIEEVDLFIVDIKMVERERHRRTIGVDNRIIHENLRSLARVLHNSGRLFIRTPLIPRYTATRENLSCLGQFIKSIDSQLSVELMNFNPLAGAKYKRMQKEYEFFQDCDAFSEKEMSEFRSIVAEHGIEVK